MKAISYSRDAQKTLLKLPANLSRLIRGKIFQYASDPASLSANVKTLKGKPGYKRLRVGDWRIIFSEDGTVIAIIEIGPRGGIYS